MNATTLPSASAFQRLSPFYRVGAGWGVIGVIGSVIGSAQPLVPAGWNLAVWVLCMADFFGTALMVRGMIGVRAGKNSTMDEASAGLSPATQALAGTTLKLACFGLLGVVLWAGKEAPLRALLLGLATMIIVPILGGVWWFEKERRKS